MQGHTPPLARLLADQPEGFVEQPAPEPRHPSWCTDHAAPIRPLPGMHQGEVHEHQGVIVRLRQADTGEPCIWLGMCRVPVDEAGDLAHVLAVWGAAEPAATVRRLGELAEAELMGLPVDAPAQPSDVPHVECTVGTRPGFARNPVTFKFEPTVAPA